MCAPSKVLGGELRVSSKCRCEGRSSGSTHNKGLTFGFLEEDVCNVGREGETIGVVGVDEFTSDWFAP